MKLNYFSKFAVAGLSLMMALPMFAGTKPLNYVEVSPIAEQGEECTVEADCTITITWNQDVKVTADDAVVFTNADNTINGVTVVDPSNKSKTITTFSSLPDGLYTLASNFAGGSIVPFDATESEYETLKVTFTVPNYRVGLPPYDYSSVKLQSIVPETMPSTAEVTQFTTDQQTITVAFDGAVEIEARSACRKVGSTDTTPVSVAVDSSVSGNTTWTVTVPANFLNSLTGDFDVLLYVKDSEGKQLAGNVEGADNREDSYFLFTYASYLGGKKGTLVCTNDKNDGHDTYSSISDFEIVFDANVVAIDKELLAEAKLMDPYGMYYVEVNAESATIDGNKVQFSLKSPVEYENTYYLTLLGGIFVGEGYISAPVEGVFTYEIVKPSYEKFDPIVTPAEGQVKSLKEIILDFSETGEAAPASGKATLKFNNDAPVDLPDLVIDLQNWSIVTQPLTADGSELTEPGQYVVSFPTGYIVSGNDQDVPAFELKYEIVDTGIVNVSVNKLYKVYNTVGTQVLNNGTAADVNALPAGIYIVNGKKVVIR